VGRAGGEAGAEVGLEAVADGGEAGDDGGVALEDAEVVRALEVAPARDAEGVGLDEAEGRGEGVAVAHEVGGEDDGERRSRGEAAEGGAVGGEDAGEVAAERVEGRGVLDVGDVDGGVEGDVHRLVAGGRVVEDEADGAALGGEGVEEADGPGRDAAGDEARGEGDEEGGGRHAAASRMATPPRRSMRRARSG